MLRRDVLLWVWVHHHDWLLLGNHAQLSRVHAIVQTATREELPLHLLFEFANLEVLLLELELVLLAEIAVPFV